jgi:predicted cobalt transporter CbtA
MIRTLLLRGMLSGMVAGMLVFFFARWTGEPQVQSAIALEAKMDQAKGITPEPEIVSRKVQRGIGLLTGALVYGAAMGGIFGLVFAFACGRIGITSSRTLAAALAGMGFTAIALVPALKYPANPPSVGNPETIGIRTAAYFLLIAFSVAVMVLTVQSGRWLGVRYGAWNGSVGAAALFVIVMIPVTHLFPRIDEVPAEFPATLLWRFRVATLETQVVLWATLGLLFGWLTERKMARASR